MIVRFLWEEMIDEIRWFKEYPKVSEDRLELFGKLLCVCFITPVALFIDILLLPFEIGYYFFNKWLDNKEQ